jgi:ABC-type transport system substrate-binding protein
LLAEVVDTTDQAKPGGVFKNFVTADVQGWDPYKVETGSAQATYNYSRLVMYAPAPYPEVPAGAPVLPDVAQEWEIAGDGTDVVFHLNPNVKFDPRPPTSSRQATAQDLVFSVDKFHATGLSRAEFFNDLHESSPVVSVEAIDDLTARVTLARPVANLMWYFAFQRYLSFMPVESDGNEFDSRAETRGSAAWRLKSWEPSSSITYESNPDWHLKAPFLETIEQPIITEYAQRRAQLIAGNLWTADIRQEDVLTVKDEQPKLNLFANHFPHPRPTFIGFSWLDGSPYFDERVRRAASMVIDRDLFIDTFYNVGPFTDAGLPVEKRWHSHFGAGEPPWWHDPQGDELGEGAQYFQLNVEEAKKMMEAAGHTQPLEALGHHQQGSGNTREVETLALMMTQSGLFNVTPNPVEGADWRKNYFNGGGLHSTGGLAMEQGPGGSGDIDAQFAVRWNVGAAPQAMLHEVYPFYEKIQSLIAEQRSELDPERRASLILEIEREAALVMPFVPWPGEASDFSLAWPHFGNFRTLIYVSLTPHNEVWPIYWYDQANDLT